MTIRFAARTDVGKVREGNEDSYLVREPVFVVADGMGGHLAGDVASQIAVDVITEETERGDGDKDALVSAIKRANAEIFEKSQNDPNLSGMGTTCTMVVVAGSEARVAHVGDSRAYILRDGTLTQLTDDHTLVNRMVKEGRLRPEDADRHPQRSIITRALGVDANVKVDYRTLQLKQGDRLLLCSDGLTSMISAGSIQRVLGEAADPEMAADDLVRLANDAGGEDNITVVIIDFASQGNGSAPVASATRTSATRTPTPVSREPRDPVRIDTSAPPGLEPVRAYQPPREWPKRILAWVLSIALVLAGLYFGVNFFLDRAWFVGANDDGFVSIYQGIPEEVAGLDLKEELNATSVSLDDLPEFLREDVEAGIKVDSEDEARAKVRDLQERAQELDEEQERDKQERRADRNRKRNNN
jgi:protein phosphatase